MDKRVRRIMGDYVYLYEDYCKWVKKQRAVQGIDDSQQARIVKAIEQASVGIGEDIFNDEIRENLKKAVYLSCIDRNEYNFDAFAGTIGCERTRFHQYKNEFLYNIKLNLGM